MFHASMKLVGIAVLAFGAVVFAAAAQQQAAKPAVPNGCPVAALGIDPQEEKALVDRYGDPLPPGAVARLGTWRFRGNSWIKQAAVVPGGKQLLALDEAIILW